MEHPEYPRKLRLKEIYYDRGHDITLTIDRENDLFAVSVDGTPGQFSNPLEGDAICEAIEHWKKHRQQGRSASWDHADQSPAPAR